MLNLLKDVFSSLQRHNVRYIVIGEIAAVLHGVPRATFDQEITIFKDRVRIDVQVTFLQA